jgi:hypothetical protein
MLKMYLARRVSELWFHSLHGTQAAKIKRGKVPFPSRRLQGTVEDHTPGDAVIDYQ